MRKARLVLAAAIAAGCAAPAPRRVSASHPGFFVHASPAEVVRYLEAAAPELRMKVEREGADRIVLSRRIEPSEDPFAKQRPRGFVADHRFTFSAYPQQEGSLVLAELQFVSAGLLGSATDVGSETPWFEGWVKELGAKMEDRLRTGGPR